MLVEGCDFLQTTRLEGRQSWIDGLLVELIFRDYLFLFC